MGLSLHVTYIGPVSNYYILISFFVRNIDFWNDRLDNFDKLSNLSGRPRVYHGGYRVQIPIKKRKQRFLIKFDRQNLSKCSAYRDRDVSKSLYLRKIPIVTPLQVSDVREQYFFPPLDICIGLPDTYELYIIYYVSVSLYVIIFCIYNLHEDIEVIFQCQVVFPTTL